MRPTGTVWFSNSINYVQFVLFYFFFYFFFADTTKKVFLGSFYTVPIKPYHRESENPLRQRPRLPGYRDCERYVTRRFKLQLVYAFGSPLLCWEERELSPDVFALRSVIQLVINQCHLPIYIPWHLRSALHPPVSHWPLLSCQIWTSKWFRRSCSTIRSRDCK